MTLGLPSLRGIEPALKSANHDPAIAKLALVAAGRGPIAPLRRTEQTLELDILHRSLTDWLERQNASLKISSPRVHINVGQFNNLRVDDGGFTLWFGSGSTVDSVWHLMNRWTQLEKEVPGLASSALSALGHAGLHSFPLYTPSICEEYASWCWWHGEMDEREVLANYREELNKPDAAVPADMITREKFDKALPRAVTRPRSNRLSSKKLKRIAGRTNKHGAIARLVLELRADCAASHRRRNEPEMQFVDDDGMVTCGFAAMLRWKDNDPMAQAFDDYFNEHSQSSSVEESYGWYSAESADELPGILKALENRYRIARKVEELIPMIATLDNR